jgi:predicted acetyltransferase
MAQMNLRDFHIVRADRSYEGTLVPLLKEYCFNMKAWLPRRSGGGEDFTYPLERVWSGDTHVYLAYVMDNPTGFALVGSAQRYGGDPSTRDMVEFFITTRLRRKGLGRTVAAYLWHQHPSNWLVRVLQRNAPAMRFWAATIASYSRGDHREEVRSISGEAWSYFTFAPSNQRLERP